MALLAGDIPDGCEPWRWCVVSSESQHAAKVHDESGRSGRNLNPLAVRIQDLKRWYRSLAYDCEALNIGVDADAESFRGICRYGG